MLAFFYEADEQRSWGFDPDDAQYWRVVATPKEHAVIAPTPDGALTFTTVHLRARRVLTLPECYEPPIHAYWEADGPAVRQLYARLSGDDQAPLHRVFGWPDLNQGPMQPNCQLASNGIWLGGPEAFENARVPDLQAGAADWVLLWQIDTDADAGCMWGDMGTMYFWIGRQDLAAGAFYRTWMVLQADTPRYSVESDLRCRSHSERERRQARGRTARPRVLPQPGGPVAERAMLTCSEGR